MSRLNFMNLRERKAANDNPQNSEGLGLMLPPQTTPADTGLKLPDATGYSYEPTTTFSNTRTSMRMLKGKFDRGSSNDNKERLNIDEQPVGSAIKNNNTSASKIGSEHTFRPFGGEDPKMSSKVGFGVHNDILNEVKPNIPKPPMTQTQTGLKLVLPDEHDPFQEKKPTSHIQAPPPVSQPSFSTSKQGFGRKILIEPPKNEQQAVRQPVSAASTVQPQEQQQKKVFEDKTEQPIIPKEMKDVDKQKEEGEAQEQQFDENQLVECPEGCGRKFHRKALETHAKACKIVFMSKRKEFNSQAKRITTKEQANLVKQAKIQEKKLGATTKMEKTGEAWKTQSEGFRAVVKALKQEEVTGIEEVKMVTCEYCEKNFTDIIYTKHLPICEAKKEKERKGASQAKRGGAKK